MKTIAIVVLGILFCSTTYAFTWDEVKDMYKTDIERNTVYLGDN